MRSRVLLVPFVVVALLGLGGCAAAEATGTKVARLEVGPLPDGTEDEIRAGLATQEAEKLFGLFERSYRSFDPEALEKDLERIERQLRRRGYYEAKVRAARVVRVDDGSVLVSIEVRAGEPVRVGRITTEGLSDPGLELVVAERALSSIQFREGDVFDEDAYDAAQTDLANALSDSGYAFVTVEGNAEVDVARRTANVRLSVELGRKAKLGRIRILGLRELPADKILRVVSLEEGSPYSRKELLSARSALYELGVFSSVRLEVDTSHPERDAVDLTIHVEEAPLRSISAGAGARIDVLRLALTGRVTWSDKNFLGGLRTLTVTNRPGLTLFPTRIDDFEKKPTALLPENTLGVRLEQPAFLEGRTRGFVETGLNVYPLLYPLPPEVQGDQAKVLGYLEIPSAFGVTRSFFGRRLPVTVSYNYRYNRPFLYQLPRDVAAQCSAGTLTGDDCREGVDPLVVTYPELSFSLDFRNDPLAPTRGLFLSLGAQKALPILGSDVQDVRLRPEIRAFWPLDARENLVLAARGTFGFLFPTNYTATNPTADDQHKLLFRAFYSGGPDSNRGYPYQRIGPQGAIAFLTPEANCNEAPLPDECTLPLGGLSLWEASLELRYRFHDPWSFVLFADASDVNIGRASFSLAAPHLSVGPGLRYASPVGPIRLDLGFRVPGAQKIGAEPNGEPPDVSEVAPYSDPSTLPLALHILIGEAF